MWSFRNRWSALLILSILITFLPHQIFGKPSRLSKNTKASRGASFLRSSQSSLKARSTKGTPDGLRCDARSAVLMDALTGQILYEQDAEEKIAPASFVKVLTLYLAFDAIQSGHLTLDERVTVSEKAWRTKGSKMFLEVGERVRVEELLKGIAVASGNDACVALAEHMAGTEEAFVSKINEKARRLGLSHSRFMNSHGMPAQGQVTTAFDMATLARSYLEDHPEALAIHGMTEFEHNGIRQSNRNTLLQKNIGVDGLKTGHVEESGYHLMATAKKDGQRMIAVVMGCIRSRQRTQEAQKLLEYGFRNFSTVEAVKQGDSFGPVQVKRGKVEEILLRAAEGMKVSVEKGKEKSVLVMVDLPLYVVAPIRKGQPLAKALVKKNGEVLKGIDLLSMVEVPRSILPPWPITLGGILALAILGFVGIWKWRHP